jgi:tRNA-2-methylthio-N6-dimethylallyladenosine synthase
LNSKENSKNKRFENFYVWVIGCQQNVHDGTILVDFLKRLGLKESLPEEADVIFIIGCAVRQTGVDRIFGRIKNWPNKLIVTSGCVLDSDKKKFREKGVVFWDIEDTQNLPKILNLKPEENVEGLLENNPPNSGSVPIMYGCDNFCSYCATPYTRGRERSRDFNKIVDETRNLIKYGHKEILLLGQNVNSYKDPSTGKNFEDLLRTLNGLPGKFIIAFTSNHPKDITSGIIDAVATLPKIKKEIHLPVQSGSDKILKAMNRPYTKKKYLEIIKKIRKANPNIEITTDVIIGFPGETEEDFQETIAVFELVGYKMAYINKYSPRVGTAAYKLGDPIPWKEKQRRWHELDKVLSKTRH